MIFSDTRPPIIPPTPSQDSKIIGFDRRDVQPDLTQLNLGIEYRDLSKRVIWMHGNLCVYHPSFSWPRWQLSCLIRDAYSFVFRSLEPLPFESDHFDFVRICCIGLEVPEDSWQELLEVRITSGLETNTAPSVRTSIYAEA